MTAETAAFVRGSQICTGVILTAIIFSTKLMLTGMIDSYPNDNDVNHAGGGGSDVGYGDGNLALEAMGMEIFV